MKFTYRFTNKLIEDGSFVPVTKSLQDNSWVENLQKGDRVIVGCVEWEGSSAESYYIQPDNGEGISGNMNPDIKCYHGWRGTTNGRSVTACGCYSVRSIERITQPHPWNREKPPILKEIVVRLNRTDLKKNES